jgi:hypothetical protein
MHDVPAHKVSLIALHAGGLEVNPAVGPEKVESSAGLIRETARQAMEDLREVLGVLQTDLSIDGADLAPVPRATDLTRLVEASRAAGVNLTSELILPSDVPVSIGAARSTGSAGVADECGQACPRRRNRSGGPRQGARRCHGSSDEHPASGCGAGIGRELFMSEATVKAHVSRVLVKLDATNRVEVAILAHDAGLLDQ